MRVIYRFHDDHLRRVFVIHIATISMFCVFFFVPKRYSVYNRIYNLYAVDRS